jgi:hypoxanthine phosphoribosyltransferase
LKLLVFSSMEGLRTAEAFKGELLKLGHEVRLWNELVFLPGQILVNALISAVPSYDAAVLVMTEDSTLTYRGGDFNAPGDNLVLELGLCLGVLGPERTFIVAPSDGFFKLPSDVDGLLHATYDTSAQDQSVSIRIACKEVAAAIGENSRQLMPWVVYEAAVRELSNTVMAHPAYGGFRPDVVVGVNPDGSIVGGLLYLLNRRAFAYATIWPFDSSAPPPEIRREAEEVIKRRGEQAEANILIVDDSLKTGKSMRASVAKVRDALGPMRHKIKAAVLVYKPEFNTTSDDFRPDYFVTMDYHAFPYCDV